MTRPVVADDARAPESDDVALASALVREAGRLAARMRADGLATEHKTGIADVVTAADRAAEELVAERLAAARPDDGVLGEEGVDRPGTTGRRWVVDPVDGTYNFVSGLDWWCSALALVDGDELLLGVVHHPATDRLYVGGPGLPTTVDGVPVGRRADVALDRTAAATYLAPRYLGADQPAVRTAFSSAAGRAAALRMLGSGSMDATAVATGVLGVQFQHTVPPWDELPGRALVLGAGGAARHVDAGGVTWYVAGAPTAVAEVAAALVLPTHA